MVCDNCIFQSQYTLQWDECGAGNTVSRCCKGHWTDDGIEEDEWLDLDEPLPKDPWKDCKDFKLNS